MKQIGPKAQKGQEGTVKLIPEEGKLVRARLKLLSNSHQIIV